MSRKKIVVIGIVGSSLDAGAGAQRWNRWRPSVDLCRHKDLPVARFELLYSERFRATADLVKADIATVSPETDVHLTPIEFTDPWDFQNVYATLHDFVRAYPFNTDKEDYLLHITTGTHVAQICWFLLTEARYLPARLLQTAPPSSQRRLTDDPNAPRPAADGKSRRAEPGTYSIIDLDLSKYDAIASRFRQEKVESVSFLKSGIDTRNAAFNALVDRIERVAVASKAPLLLMGPTGSGKSLLARRIFELKKSRRQVEGDFVELNCATLRGDAAMSALFGHTKGAFTGALQPRPGLLRAADGGVLFLDEIGELGPDEQAMLLRALEEKTFLPLGADKEVQSNFQLIAGTNRDLGHAVAVGEFREDLFARINLWTFVLPALRERTEDIEPNLQYELDQFARREGTNVTFNREAREKFLDFARSPAALWTGNFRDLSGSVHRMATLAPAARITPDVVEQEIAMLKTMWRHVAGAGAHAGDGEGDLLAKHLSTETLRDLDPFDRVQLAEVLRVCARSASLSEAGRTLFAASRRHKKVSNDADRLRKYLARFDLDWPTVHG